MPASDSVGSVEWRGRLTAIGGGVGTGVRRPNGSRVAEHGLAVGLFALVIGPPIALTPFAQDWSWGTLGRGLAVGVGGPVAVCTVCLIVGRAASWRDRRQAAQGTSPES